MSSSPLLLPRPLGAAAPRALAVSQDTSSTSSPALATMRSARRFTADAFVRDDPSRHARTTGPRGVDPVAPSLLSPTAVKNAVVVGAGPCGLLAALELVQNGASVTLVEQRGAYTRPIHWNVRADLLHRIAETCPAALPRILDRLGVIESVERIDATQTALPADKLAALQAEKAKRKVSLGIDGLRFQQRGPAAPEADAQRARWGGREMLVSPSIGQIVTTDLENILFEELERLARAPKGDQPTVTILRNHRCDLSESADKPGWSACTVYEVAQHVGADGKVRFEPTGERKAIGTPDLIINCDGANSVMRERAGIPRTHVSQATRFIAAAIAATEITDDAPRGGVARRRYAELTNPEDGSIHGVRQVVLGSTATPQLWVLVEVPPFVDLGNKDAVTRYFQEHASLVLGRPLADARITWGPNPFTMQQFISASAIKGENVIFAGDAVGNAHFLTSGGVMTATVPHVFALERLLANLADGVPRRRALERYNAWTLAATKAWLRLGFKEFGRQGEQGETFEAAMTAALQRLRDASQT